METTRQCWNKSKTWINGKPFHDYKLENVILSIWQYSPEWSSHWRQSKPKFNGLFFGGVGGGGHEKLILKFIWKYEESPNSQNNFEKKIGGLTLLVSKLKWSKFTSLLEFVTKSILAALAFGAICRHNRSDEILSRPRPMFPTRVAQGCPLPSCLRSHL